MSDLIATVLTSTLIATGVTNIITFAAKALDSGKSAKNNALYAAIALEEWVFRCWNITADMLDYHGTEGQLGKSHPSLPELINLRKEIDLSSIDIKLRADLLTLMARIDMSNYKIADTLQEDRVHMTDDHGTERGVEAVALSAKLRKKYGLSENTEPQYLHCCRMLAESKVTLDEKNAKRRARRAIGETPLLD